MYVSIGGRENGDAPTPRGNGNALPEGATGRDPRNARCEIAWLRGI